MDKMYNILSRFKEFIDNGDYVEAKEMITEWLNDPNCTLNDLSILMGPISEQVLSSNEYYNPAKTQLAIAALESLAHRSLNSFDEDVLEDILWNIIDYSEGFEIEYPENMDTSFALKEWIIELLNNKFLCRNIYQRLEFIRFLTLFVIDDTYNQATWARIVRGITSTLCHLDIAYITGTTDHRVHLNIRAIKKLFIHLSLKCQLVEMANKITSQIVSRYHESELQCIFHIIRMSQNLAELGIAKYRLNRNTHDLNKTIYLSMKTLGIIYDDKVHELRIACCHPYMATYTTSAISSITNAILTLTCVHGGESKTEIFKKQLIFKIKMEVRDILIKHLPIPKVTTLPILLFQREHLGQTSRLNNVVCSLPNCMMLQGLGTLKAPPN